MRVVAGWRFAYPAYKCIGTPQSYRRPDKAQPHPANSATVFIDARMFS
ncbi:hypothetical protein [Pseudocitrobacter sp. 73]|nr:hypothetical protein [Pseudocitrobacter sp. 73]